MTDLHSRAGANVGGHYSRIGRPSIAPERLLRASLLQVLYTIRSERQLMEQLDFNLLFRWFVGLGMDERVWERTVFCANRDRLLEKGLLRIFFERVLMLADSAGLISDEHFSVDGTMIDAWASHKSFKRKDQIDKGNDDADGGSADGGRNRTVDFRGEKRSNQAHQSSTDSDAPAPAAEPLQGGRAPLGGRRRKGKASLCPPESEAALAATWK